MEAIKAPDVRQEGRDIHLSWNGLLVEATVSDIISARDGPKAEVWVRHKTAGHIHGAMLNLMSTSGRVTFTKALVTRDPSTNWEEVVEQICILSTKMYREGEPLTLLEPRRRPEAGRFAIAPLLPIGQPTLWFGDGKSGKIMMALAAARAIRLGQSLAQCAVPAPLNIAYLDWEWDQDEHEDRLLRLGGDVTLFYRRCTAPLIDQARQLERQLSRAKIDIVVVDSLGFACGGNIKDPEPVLGFFAAVRTLAPTALIVHHVAKDSKEPYGSVYIRNSVRSAWYVLRGMLPEAGVLRCAFKHNAANSGQLQADMAFKLTFDEEAYTTTVEREDVGNVPELAEGKSIKAKILDAVRLKPKTRHELADELEEPVEKISVHLSQLGQQERLINMNGAWGMSSSRRA